jgi:hypothetical protein
LPAAPVANSSTVSEVEVSPSTVMQLKLLSTLFVSSFCRRFGGSAASVKMKTSMVAMSGAIMPEPLAMPLMVTVLPPSFALTVAALGNVSVVMMALAAMDQASGSAASASFGRALVMKEGSSGSPMTPVEAWKISTGLQSRSLPAAFATAVTVATPALPVKALAFPALMTTARAVPPFRLSAHQSTGAERDLDLVKQPATLVPGSITASNTSGRFL